MFKKLKKLFIVLPTAVFLTAYGAIPKNIQITQGQTLDFKWGISSEANSENTGNYTCKVKLFNFIPIKTVSVSVIPNRYVIPSGRAIGVRIYTDGVLVIGTGEVSGNDGTKYYPARDAGIKPGDRIIAVNGENFFGTEALSKKLNEHSGNAVLTVMRGQSEFEIEIKAVYSSESGGYKAGIWVRDSTAGIGTMTFYDPETSVFAALGHGICDSDTKDILTISRGNISLCGIKNVFKGKNGVPGELCGNFSDDIFGKITKNCLSGIYGTLNKPISDGEKIAVASRFQVKEGDAEILCDIDGNGPEYYKIKIVKVSKVCRESNKDMVIKVTDPILKEKTGGIVQGMSGSPIIQNDMLVGAVTHVFVNDPTKGYGIFIENMLDEAGNVN